MQLKRLKKYPKKTGISAPAHISILPQIDVFIPVNYKAQFIQIYIYDFAVSYILKY